MMERSLLYVSRPSSFIVDPEQMIGEIVAEARSHNKNSGITGALAFTQDHFAQLIEGPSMVLDDLMHRIDRDRRHTDVTILRVEAISRRRLPDWSMAYSGTSSYVARRIVPLVGEMTEANPARIERLVSLLVGLAGPVCTLP